jgi:hypothetical protein
MSLRDRQRDYYYKYLDKYYPGKKELYIKTFGDAYSCSSPNAKQLNNLLEKKCAEKNILYKMIDINTSFLKIKEQLSFEF